MCHFYVYFYVVKNISLLYLWCATSRDQYPFCERSFEWKGNSHSKKGRKLVRSDLCWEKVLGSLTLGARTRDAAGDPEKSTAVNWGDPDSGSSSRREEREGGEETTTPSWETPSRVQDYEADDDCAPEIRCKVIYKTHLSAELSCVLRNRLCRNNRDLRRIYIILFPPQCLRGDCGNLC